MPGAAPVLDALADVPGVWVVGGAVRDTLLGRDPRDLDLVVEGDAAAAARRLGDDAVVHERFGTANAPGAVNVAAARRETYARPGALPDVELGASIGEDLARRDFSVNAIAVRVADGELEAVPGALEDLSQHRLRVLHQRSFLDDPTRLLRLIRYVARLRFPIEEATRGWAFEAVEGGALDTVTPPRLGAELRLLLGEPVPAAICGLEALGAGPAAAARLRRRPRPHRARAAPDPARREPRARGAGLVPARRLGARARGAPRRVRVPGPRPRRHRRRRHPRAGAGPGAGRDGRAVRDLDAAAPRGPPRRWRSRARSARRTPRGAGSRSCATRSSAIGGGDLLAAGLEGPAVGRALEAATAAMLDGEAPDRDRQLGRGPRHNALMDLPSPFTWRDEHIGATLPGGEVLFSTRRGGVSEGPFASLNLGRLTDDPGENVDVNRERLAAAVGAPRERFLYGRQVHEATVRRATEPPGPERPHAPEDGQATALDDAPALVFVADCLPVMLVADGAVAALHGGWRGLAAGIVEEGVTALRELGAEGEIHAALGPSARGCCYEVGEEVHARVRRPRRARRRAQPRPARRVARQQLAAASVDGCCDVSLCTRCPDARLLLSPPPRRQGHGAPGGGRVAGLISGVELETVRRGASACSPRSPRRPPRRAAIPARSSCSPR